MGRREYVRITGCHDDDELEDDSGGFQKRLFCGRVIYLVQASWQVQED
jgi:hypothetical protein